MPFDRLLLHWTNYLHLGAALFDRRLLDSSTRFDDRFKWLHDWDFWIQLSLPARLRHGMPEIWCSLSNELISHGLRGAARRRSAAEQPVHPTQWPDPRPFCPLRLRAGPQVVHGSRLSPWR